MAGSPIQIHYLNLPPYIKEISKEDGNQKISMFWSSGFNAICVLNFWIKFLMFFFFSPPDCTIQSSTNSPQEEKPTIASLSPWILAST